MLEDQLRQRVALREFLEHVLGRRGLAGGRLAHHRQLHLLEQDVAELLRRIEVERRAGFAVRLAQQFHEPLAELACSACAASAGRAARRVLPCAAAPAPAAARISSYSACSAGLGRDLRPQHLVQAQRHVGVFGRILGGLVHRHLAEGDLLRAFAGHVFVVNGADAEITLAPPSPCRGASPRCSRHRTRAWSRSACRRAGCRGWRARARRT